MMVPAQMNQIHIVQANDTASQSEHDESDSNCTDEDDESDPATENVTDAPTPVVPISPEPAPAVPIRHPVPTPRRSIRTKR